MAGAHSTPRECELQKAAPRFVGSGLLDPLRRRGANSLVIWTAMFILSPKDPNPQSTKVALRVHGDRLEALDGREAQIVEAGSNFLLATGEGGQMVGLASHHRPIQKHS
jgi:hypothetical protein